MLTAAGAAALLVGSGADVARAADSAVAAPVDVTGTVRTVVVDDVRGAGPGARPTAFHPVSQTRTVVEVGTTAYEVPADVARTTLAGARTGDRARITLSRKAGARTATVVAATPTGRRAAAAPNVIGTHTLTVLPVYFSAKDSQTQASLQNLADLTAMYWSQQSGGKIDVQTSARDWKQIASPSSCDYTAIANAAYAAHGITTSPSLTNHYLIYFPTRNDCSFAGLAYIGYGTIWINGYAYVEVTAHEFGHNLGVGHANTALCTSGSTQVPWASTCSNKEYNDWIDVMGAGGQWQNKAGNFNAAFADYLGIATVTKLTAAGTSTVAPAAQVTANRAVRIDMPNGVPVYVEYRPTGGNDFRQPGWGGVQVRQRVNLNSDYFPSSQLLDIGASSFSNPSLPQWAVWPVPGTGLAVKVTGLTADAATVSVVATNGDTTAPPAVTPAAPVSGSTVPPASMLAWTAPTDAGGAGLASFALWVDGTLRTRVGASTTTWTLPTLPDGSHTVRVDTTDNAGNTSTGATVTFTVSSTAPTTPPKIVTPAAGAWTGSSLAVSWSVDKATAAAVLVDGSVAATVASGTTTATVTGLADGAHSLTVAARDSSGATLATSTAVAVTTDGTAPTTPSGLVVAGTRATWTASTDATSGVAGYRVSVDGNAPTTVTSPSATLAVADGTHTVAVTAVDRAGNASGTTSTSFVRDATAPTGLTVTAPAANAVLGSTAVRLSWTAATDPQSGVTGYRVTAPGLTAPVTLGADATSYDLTLPQGASTLKLAAVNGAGGVQELAVKVTVDSLAPAAPTALALSRDGTKLSWRWTKDSGTAVTFRVVVDGGAAVTATGTSLPLTLAPGQHTASVTAVDAAGNTSSAASLTAYADTTAPDAPVLLTPADNAVSGVRTLALTWTAPTDAESGLSGYLVTVNGRKLEPVGPSATGTSVLATADGKVTVTVQAVNGAGLVGPAAKAAVLVDTLAPGAPTKLAATAAGVLTWVAPADRGSPVSWRVSVDGGTPVTVAERTYTASAPGQHTFAVTAVDAAGNSSSAVSLTRWVDGSAPGSPSGLTPATGAAVGTRTPTVSWSAATDDDSGVAAYVVAVNGRTVATVGGDVTSATVPVPEGAVTVTVRAVNLAGVPGEPATVTFVTDTSRPNKPAGVTLGADDLLTWTAPTDTGRVPTGVVQYVLYLDGVEVSRTTAADGTSAQVATPSGTHVWTVAAVDAAGNVSLSAATASVSR